jgi:hypothetical protein
MNLIAPHIRKKKHLSGSHPHGALCNFKTFGKNLKVCRPIEKSLGSRIMDFDHTGYLRWGLFRLLVCRGLPFLLTRKHLG